MSNIFMSAGGGKLEQAMLLQEPRGRRVLDMGTRSPSAKLKAIAEHYRIIAFDRNDRFNPQALNYAMWFKRAVIGVLSDIDMRRKEKVDGRDIWILEPLDVDVTNKGQIDWLISTLQRLGDGFEINLNYNESATSWAGQKLIEINLQGAELVVRDEATVNGLQLTVTGSDCVSVDWKEEGEGRSWLLRRGERLTAQGVEIILTNVLEPM